MGINVQMELVFSPRLHHISPGLAWFFSFMHWYWQDIQNHYCQMLRIYFWLSNNSWFKILSIHSHGNINNWRASWAEEQIMAGFAWEAEDVAEEEERLGEELHSSLWVKNSSFFCASLCSTFTFQPACLHENALGYWITQKLHKHFIAAAALKKFVCMCMCVWERVRERESERARKSLLHTSSIKTQVSLTGASRVALLQHDSPFAKRLSEWFHSPASHNH